MQFFMNEHSCRARTMSTILAIIDTISDRAPSGSDEIISFARELASCESLNIIVIVAGENPNDQAKALTRHGHRVIVIAHESFRYPNPDLLARECILLAEELRPRYICLPHTMRGCQAATQIAVAARYSCITAVESFRWYETAPVFKRSMFNGKVFVELSIAGPGVFTVLPGSYPRPKIGEECRIRPPLEVRTSLAPSPVKPHSIMESDGGAEKLEEADVIVAAGRGIGSRDNLELIAAVAKLFPNSAVGASRTICDLKWLPHGRQVGVTGKTVSPRLYLACGISGAQQHIAGIRGSQLIISVNKDPQAAIFDISDYIVVEDLNRFLPALLEKYREIFSRG